MELSGISFLGSPAKAGKHFYLTIPRSYINNSLIDTKRAYKVNMLKIIDERPDLSDVQKLILKALNDEDLATIKNLIKKLQKGTYNPKKLQNSRLVYFFGKPATSGKHCSFTIPKIFIENGILSINHLYRVYPEEVNTSTRKIFDELSKIVVEQEIEDSKEVILKKIVEKLKINNLI